MRILVTSIPRSGSTMLFRSLIGAEPGSHTPREYQGPHLKAHSFSPSDYVGRVDVAIFLFGDVISSVVSTQRNRLEENHFRNCGAPDLRPAEVDLSTADYLNYEKMFDAWMQRNSIPHACVRYERLHALAPAVSTLIGKSFVLPEKKPKRGARHETIDTAIIEQVSRTYNSLIKKVDSAPDLLWFD